VVVVVVERRYGGLVVVFEKKWKGKNIDGRADRVSVVMRVRMGMVRVYMTMRSARRCGKECASRGSGGWWFLCTFLLFFFLSCLLACLLVGWLLLPIPFFSSPEFDFETGSDTDRKRYLVEM